MASEAQLTGKRAGVGFGELQVQIRLRPMLLKKTSSRWPQVHYAFAKKKNLEWVLKYENYNEHEACSFEVWW